MVGTMQSLTRTLGLALLMLSAVAVGALDSEDSSAARTVVDQYFDALSRGDTDALEVVLTGRMWERMSRRMVNPNYSTFLQEQYGGTTYSIQDAEELTEAGVQITVEVSFQGSEPEIYTLLLRRGEEPESEYRIYEEF